MESYLFETLHDAPFSLRAKNAKPKKCVTFVTSVEGRVKDGERQASTVVTFLFFEKIIVTIVTESGPISRLIFSSRLAEKCNRFCNRFCNGIKRWFSGEFTFCYKSYTFFGIHIKFQADFSRTFKNIHPWNATT